MENFELKVKEFASNFYLTPRETEVLREMLLGNTLPEGISAALILSPNTVRAHLRAINFKFGTNSKIETVAKFIGFLF